MLSLLRVPMSGTDLIRLFEDTIQHFWKTDLSQIYRALEALEGDGCVRASSVPSARGPARKVYRLTAKGRRRLAAWISEPPRVPPAKFEYLAQLFSVTASDEPRKKARELLVSLRDEAAKSVAVLEAIDATLKRMPGYPDEMPSSVFYPWLTLRHGLHRRRGFLRWIDECLDRLERRSRAVDGRVGSEPMSELLDMLGENR